MSHIATIRLPSHLADVVYESDAVADAGFRPHAGINPKGMPGDTGWTTFRIECPRMMEPREIVATLASLCQG